MTKWRWLGVKELFPRIAKSSPQNAESVDKAGLDSLKSSPSS